jgi:hypothetical protein
MTSPAQLTAAELLALHDEVIALFGGKRDARTMILDPAMGQSTGALWLEATAGLGSDVDDPTHFLCAVASNPELLIPIPLNEGDRVTEVKVSVKQMGTGVITAVLYRLEGTGTPRVRIASAKTSGATVDYQELTLAVVGADGDVGPLPYLVPADKAMVLVIQAGNTAAGDAFGGGELTFDHPYP